MISIFANAPLSLSEIIATRSWQLMLSGGFFLVFLLILTFFYFRGLEKYFYFPMLGSFLTAGAFLAMLECGPTSPPVFVLIVFYLALTYFFDAKIKANEMKPTVKQEAAQDQAAKNDTSEQFFEPPNFDLTDEEIELCHSFSFDLENARFLKSLTGQPVTALEFMEEYASIEPDYVPGAKPKCLQSVTSEDNAHKIVFEHYDAFQKRNQLIFLSHVSRDWCGVAIASFTSDPFEILRLAETNGENDSVSAEMILAKINEWNSKFGVKIIGIEFDTCELQILDKNCDLDYLELAKDVERFCCYAKGIYGYDVETTEELAESMKTRGTILLWWD